MCNYRFVMQRSSSMANKKLGHFVNKTDDLIFSDILPTNFLRVNVYLQSIELESSHQQVSYDAASLFSDVGGTMGLYAGVSIITLIELIVFLTSFNSVIMTRCIMQKKVGVVMRT